MIGCRFFLLALTAGLGLAACGGSEPVDTGAQGVESFCARYADLSDNDPTVDLEPNSAEYGEAFAESMDRLIEVAPTELVEDLRAVKEATVAISDGVVDNDADALAEKLEDLDLEEIGAAGIRIEDYVEANC